MIKVYLDSQDFANLYKDQIDSELTIVREKLLNWKRLGVVKFPLSFLTLFEFVQDFQTDYEADRQRRSEFLSQLCGTETVPFFLDLARKGVPIDTASWLPYGSFEKFSVAHLLSVIRYQIKSQQRLPRQQRRDLQSPLVLRKFLKQILLNQNRNEIVPSNLHLDLSTLNFDFFIDFLLEKIDENEANRQFQESVFEPAKFFSIWYQRFSKKNALKEFFGGAIDQFYATAVGFNKKLPELFEQLKASRNELKIHKNKQVELSQKLKVLGVDLNHEPISVPDLPSWNETFRASILPKNLDMFTDPVKATFESYFKALFEKQFVPKKSDIVDIFHSVYIEQVELWRTDRSFAQFLIRSNIYPAEKIVESLRELPSRIDSVLANEVRPPVQTSSP